MSSTAAATATTIELFKLEKRENRYYLHIYQPLTNSQISHIVAQLDFSQTTASTGQGITLFVAPGVSKRAAKKMSTRLQQCIRRKGLDVHKRFESHIPQGMEGVFMEGIRPLDSSTRPPSRAAAAESASPSASGEEVPPPPPPAPPSSAASNFIKRSSNEALRLDDLRTEQVCRLATMNFVCAYGARERAWLEEEIETFLHLQGRIHFNTNAREWEAASEQLAIAHAAAQSRGRGGGGGGDCSELISPLQRRFRTVDFMEMPQNAADLLEQLEQTLHLEGSNPEVRLLIHRAGELSYSKFSTINQAIALAAAKQGFYPEDGPTCYAWPSCKPLEALIVARFRPWPAAAAAAAAETAPAPTPPPAAAQRSSTSFVSIDRYHLLGSVQGASEALAALSIAPPPSTVGARLRRQQQRAEKEKVQRQAGQGATEKKPSEEQASP